MNASEEIRELPRDGEIKEDHRRCCRYLRIKGRQEASKPYRSIRRGDADLGGIIREGGDVDQAARGWIAARKASCRVESPR